MKALITGISGFAGSHLADWLLQCNMEVYGTVRQRSHTGHVGHLEKRITLSECDLMNPGSVNQLLADVNPDLIFHLAAQSFVPASWNTPAETIMNNAVGQLNLLEAVRQLRLDCKIHIACSSEEYGQVEPGELPVKETNPLKPLNPYAVSKVTQDMLGYQYFKNYGMFIVRTRSFNHAGPRQAEHFVTASFAKQIAEIEKAIKPPVIRVGNLRAIRDFTDVRDMVRAYVLALERGVAGECYNLASGVGISIAEMLGILLSMSKVKIEVQQETARMRPSDVEMLIGDSTKFRLATGWEPGIAFHQTLEDLLNYWRMKV